MKLSGDFRRCQEEGIARLFFRHGQIGGKKGIVTGNINTTPIDHQPKLLNTAFVEGIPRLSIDCSITYR